MIMIKDGTSNRQCWRGLSMSYNHPLYAQSLREFGEPRELPRCGGWILARKIPGTPYTDAMGPYPLFSCHDWTKLHEDLDKIGSDLISLSLVINSFSGVALAQLEGCFDIVKLFKTHYIVDLSYPLESFVNKVHQYRARRSLKGMEVEVCLEPIQYLDEWVKLYNNLIKRHNIKGIQVFSPKSFEIQLRLPGMIMIVGKHEGAVLGAHLVMVQDDTAYGHLAAFSPEGYKIKASYGIYWMALKYLGDQGIQLYDMGGGAGMTENTEDGLSKFKKGWSNDRRMVYFCGRVFDRQKYDSVCQRSQVVKADYFPTYRVGEFNV
jgi:hypothetical protein